MQTIATISVFIVPKTRFFLQITRAFLPTKLSKKYRHLPFIYRLSTVFNKAKMQNKKQGLVSKFQNIENKIKKK